MPFPAFIGALLSGGGSAASGAAGATGAVGAGASAVSAASTAPAVAAIAKTTQGLDLVVPQAPPTTALATKSGALGETALDSIKASIGKKLKNAFSPAEMDFIKGIKEKDFGKTFESFLEITRDNQKKKKKKKSLVIPTLVGKSNDSSTGRFNTREKTRIS